VASLQLTVCNEYCKTVYEFTDGYRVIFPASSLIASTISAGFSMGKKWLAPATDRTTVS